MTERDEQPDETEEWLRQGFYEASRSSSFMAKNFLGNLAPSLWEEGSFHRISPDQIADKVSRVMVGEIDLFEKEEFEDGERFKREENGRLVAHDDVRETHGITVAEIEAIYDFVEEPITLERLHELIDPLQAKIDELYRHGGVF